MIVDLTQSIEVSGEIPVVFYQSLILCPSQ